MQIPYSAGQLSRAALSLKEKKEFSSDPSTEKRLILISDFQDNGMPSIQSTEDYEQFVVQLSPESTNNIAIDSVYASTSNTTSLRLEAVLSASERQETNVPVSLFNGDQLVAKGTASFDENLRTNVGFDIEVQGDFEGRLTIDDPHLGFDNSLFFSLNTNRPIKVLSINEAEDRFLARVYRNPEFVYSSVALSNLDFSSINDFNLVILNEVKTPSIALGNALAAFSREGGSVLIIPSEQSTAINYGPLLSNLGGMQLGDAVERTRLITTINYDHPLYRDVFETRIKNFQYPSLSKSFSILNGDALLSFEDGAAFLAGRGNTYVMSGGINNGNSNFKNSPLIVPTLYNIGKQSLALPQLYFQNGANNAFDIPIALQEDAILSLGSLEEVDKTWIPLQQTYGNKVTITTSEQPEKAGIYTVMLKDSLIQQLSYNYSRNESILRYQQMAAQEGITYSSSVTNLFDELKQGDEVNALWKWFVIFALIFLLLEMLILKYLK